LFQYSKKKELYLKALKFSGEINWFKVQLKANVSEKFSVISIGVDERNDRI
jgi:hypothetical protein